MSLKSKKHSRHSLVRLYIDIRKGLYWLLAFTNAKSKIEIPVTMSSLEKAKRGEPWECWLAKAITKFSKEHPDAFPHEVKYVYVIRSAIYIVDRYKNGQPSHAVRYFHDRGTVVKQFDRLSRADFLKFFTENFGEEMILTMRPAVKRGGEDRPGARDRRRKPDEMRHGTGGVQAVSHGAMRRAKDAGLIPLSA